MKRKIALLLYRCIFSHLPVSHNKLMGGVSSKLRRWASSYLFEYCGKNVNIEKGAQFGSGSKIRIGDNSGIGVNCVIPNGSHIGSNVMMGPNCFIHHRNHRFDRMDIPMIEQGYSPSEPITIEDDVWIGQNVTIMVGRHISKGTIVAANSVVTKDFPEYSIIGGNPAKLIRNRKDNLV